MSMDLHNTIDHDELFDADRFDFLIGVTEQVERVDELHASKDDDSNFIFIVWAKNPQDYDSLVKAINKNIAYWDVRSGWKTEVYDTQVGILIVNSTINC